MTEPKLSPSPRSPTSRYFFLALLAGCAYVFFRLLEPFLLPIFLAAVFCSLFFPLYERLARGLRGRRGIASFLTCLILLVGLVVPLYWVAALVVKEAISFYGVADAKVREIVAQGDAGPLGTLRQLRVVRLLDLDQIDWRSNVQGLVKTLGGLLSAAVAAVSSGTLKVIVTLFITLFTMFYFFLDGKALVQRIKELLPLDRRHEDAIVARFASVSRATIRGTLLIALVQGSLGGLTLWVFGVGSPVLWGVVATLLAIVPMAGAGVVLLPAAVIQMLTGHLWQGIAIAAITLVVINNIDNVLRVRLVGQEAGLHDLMVFFSTLGGIQLFGPMGFIAGPMIAALFLALVDIYGRELRQTPADEEAVG